MVCLVFFGKEDCEYPCRFLRIGRVFTATFKRGIIVINLPEKLLFNILKRTKVVLTIGIITLGKIIEGLDLFKDGELKV